MKRYVNEFATDTIKHLNGSTNAVEKAKKITELIKLCERCYITEFEAIKHIISIIERV